ncbi:MAG: GNAT family N-acetyltransferase [Clostridia bacterium]|nr:GNAT family N-acetyltransferase [Clostridia bacterium]
MDILYRKATSDDCLALAELKGRVWNTTYKGIYSDETLQNYDVAKNQSIFESIVANPEIELYLAECNGTAVGLMTCGKPFRPFMHYEQEIGLLYILKSYQRRGIGRGFFELARQQVKNSGHREFLVSVNKLNKPAIDFYLAMGGKVVLTDEKQMKIGYCV